MSLAGRPPTFEPEPDVRDNRRPITKNRAISAIESFAAQGPPPLVTPGDPVMDQRIRQQAGRAATMAPGGDVQGESAVQAMAGLMNSRKKRKPPKVTAGPATTIQGPFGGPDDGRPVITGPDGAPAGPPGPPVPSPPPAPVDGVPFSAEFQNYLAALQAQADTALAQANEQAAAFYQQNIDPTNPFSNQALLQRSHQQAVRQNSLSFGSRGSLYSGGLEAVGAKMGVEQQGETDRFLRQYEEGQAQIVRNRDTTLGAIKKSIDEAIFKYVMEHANEIPTAPTGGADAGLPDGTVDSGNATSMSIGGATAIKPGKGGKAPGGGQGGGHGNKPGPKPGRDPGKGKKWALRDGKWKAVPK